MAVHVAIRVAVHAAICSAVRGRLLGFLRATVGLSSHYRSRVWLCWYGLVQPGGWQRILQRTDFEWCGSRDNYSEGWLVTEDSGEG